MSRKMLEKSKITTNLLKDLLINSPGKCILSTKMTKIDDADDTLFLTYPYYQKSTCGHWHLNISNKVDFFIFARTLRWRGWLSKCSLLRQWKIFFKQKYNVMSYQNHTIYGSSLMHRTRKTLLTIGTTKASLEHAQWAAVRMFLLYCGS